MIKINNFKRPMFSVPNVMANLVKIATSSRRYIQARTESGKDVNGSSFVSYSDAYLQQKAKRGLTGSVVTLRDKGNMMRSLSLTKSGQKVILYLNDKNRAIIGYTHQTGSGKVPKRHWFGLNQADADRIYLKYGLDKPIVSFK